MSSWIAEKPIKLEAKEGTCATCAHWQPAEGKYVAACTSRKAGLGAVIQRSGSSSICRWDFKSLLKPIEVPA